MLRVHIIDGVPNQAGVAIAGLVEGVEDSLPVRLVLLLLELLGFEKVIPLVGVGLLHVLGEFVLRDVGVADEIDVLDTDLVAFLDVEVHPDGAADHRVLLDLRVHLAEEVSLFLVVTLDDVFGSTLHVIGEFAARTEVQTLLEIFPLAGLDAGIGPAGDSRALLDHHLEPGGVAGGVQGIHPDGHVLEITLGDQTLHHARHVLARNGDGHAFLESGQLEDLVLAEVLVAFDAHPADNVFLRIRIIYLDRVSAVLRPQDRSRESEKQQAGGLPYLHR